MGRPHTEYMRDRSAVAVPYLVVHKELGQHEEEAECVHPWGDKIWLESTCEL